MSKEPLYPHVPKSKEPLFPHVTKGQSKESYTTSELDDIARIFYDTSSAKRATTFAGLRPLYEKWEDLSQAQRDEAIEGLRVRIEREGLLGYLERKRPAAGNELTDSIITQLKAKGYLSSNPGSVHTIPEPLDRELRRELRKLPAWKLQEVYDMLKIGEPTTGIDILDKHRDEAVEAVKEALWERGKLSSQNEYIEIPFSSAGASDIQWETELGEKLITVTVTNIRGVSQYELAIDFRLSVARVTNLQAVQDLPFSGASRGKLWWLGARYYKVQHRTVTVEVSGIRLATGMRLEDVFANSIARIEVVNLSSLAETDGNPVSKYCCRQCGECAPAELLGEGKFPERISWLRHHYQERHPGVWGKVGSV